MPNSLALPRSFSVCVYCGSRDGADPSYRAAALALGQGLGVRGWRLVYGAGDVGIMGAVSEAAAAAGAESLGIIPTHLMSRERQGTGQSQLVITETMHERKKVMVMNSDAVVVLPGGAGTLDEFFEVLTWRQLGLHDKPIVVVDVAGYWAPLEGLLTHIITQGFADASMRDYVWFETSVETALARLDSAAVE